MILIFLTMIMITKMIKMGRITLMRINHGA